MMPWLRRILICLVLGAATTVAVAWGSILWTVFDGSVAHERPIRPAEWPSAVPDDWPAAPSVVAEFSTLSITLFEAHAPERALPRWGADTFLTQRVWSSGLPLRSLMRVTRGPEFLDFAPANLREGVATPAQLSWLSRDFGNRPVLPVLPIWPGFLIDTLFYAALWCGVFVGFGAMKRAIRRRRGRCEMCAYDLRGDFQSGCPECGWNRSEPGG